MGTRYQRFLRPDVAALVDFLSENDWPFYPDARRQPHAIRQRVDDEFYDGNGVETFWIVERGCRVGLLRIHDLQDPTPLFDLRIAAAHRGHGAGTRAVTWLTARVFTGRDSAERIEATTRQDNAAMRRVLRRCGYVKEAHYRDAWPGVGRERYDSVGYAILRKDWGAGTTTSVHWHDEEP